MSVLECVCVCVYVCVSPTVTLGRQEELGGHDPGKRRLAASAGGRPVVGPRSRGQNSYARSQTASQTFCWRGRQTVTQTRVPELHARRMRAVSCCLACRHARAERGRTPATASPHARVKERCGLFDPALARD